MHDPSDISAFLERAGEPCGDAEARLRCEVSGGVGVVVIDNVSARNALSLAMWASIRDCFRALEVRDDLRVVVLRGAGSTAFAAGADIAEFPALRQTASDAARYNDVLGDALRAVAALSVPTIAAIQGFAVGGGCEVAAACDLRIGATDARIGIPIGRLGVVLGVTETRLLVRHVGVNGLKRMLFTGELFDASESRQLGLLDEVVAVKDLWSRVGLLCHRLVVSSAVTVRAAKVITDLAGDMEGAAAERMHRILVAAYDGPELREGVAAFLEKREPDFLGVGARA